MPRNSQGLYTLPAGNPVVPNTLIEANWANPTMDDIAAALTGSLPRDGSAPMTGLLTLSADAPTQPRNAISKGYLDQFLAYATGMPIGSVVAYAGASVPAGFFECNGQAVSRTTYADLFATIGTIYGAGDSSTTFNVPDMRDEFIRGKSAARAVGSKQAASFASHTHTYSDPGHKHTLNDPGHSHTATQPQHNHGVNDPGHSHPQTVSSTPGSGFAYGTGNIAGSNTANSGTGITIQLGGGEAVTVAARTTGISLTPHTTDITIGGTGGTETVPQNIAQIYVIKAVNDTTGPVPVTSIDTSDAEMISVDNTNPVVPELVIRSNVAFGVPKLDASGKVGLAQMPTDNQSFLGYFDASGGSLPSGVYASGDYYAISVTGTLNVYDPVTLVASPTVVAVGSQIHYVNGSITNPDGWYYVTVSGATLASDVQFIPIGTIVSTNVQSAIAELDAATIGPVFSARRTTSQVVVSGTDTAILFNVEDFDTAASYDPATGKFQPNVAGYYQINALAMLSTDGVLTGAKLVILKNGTTNIGSFYKKNTYITSAVGALVYMNGSTDYVQAVVNIVATINAYVEAASTLPTVFSGSFIRGV